MRSPSLLTRRSAGLPPLDILNADLRHASTLQRNISALLPLITLAGFFGAFSAHLLWLLPLIVTAHFVVTVAYLHDVAHGSTGLNRAQSHWTLFLYAAFLLQSGHSFRYTHLFHHAHCLQDDDLEGAPARASLWHAILAGPSYLPRLWRKAMRETNAAQERGWMIAEMANAILVPCLAVWIFKWSAAPLLYCSLMYLGGWAYPVTTAYLPHYHPGTEPLEQARTLRGALVPALFRNLTYHLEHHLYPQVPAANLRRLAVLLEPLLAARGLHPTQVP